MESEHGILDYLNIRKYIGYEEGYWDLFIDQSGVSSDDGDDVGDDQVVLFTEADVIPPMISVPMPKNCPFADAISPSTLIFMATLMNNNHPWFTRLYKDKWKATKNDFEGFIGIIGQELHHDIDFNVPLAHAKTAVCKQHVIQRGTVETKLYHTSLGAHFRRKSSWSYSEPGYSISVQPGNQTIVSVGAAVIPDYATDKFRRAMLHQAYKLREALSTDYVKYVFGGDKIGLDLLDTHGKTMTVPQGYDNTINSYNSLLTYNRFLVNKRFDDIDVVSQGFMDKVLDVYAALTPFLDLLCEWGE